MMYSLSPSDATPPPDETPALSGSEASALERAVAASRTGTDVPSPDKAGVAWGSGVASDGERLYSFILRNMMLMNGFVFKHEIFNTYKHPQRVYNYVECVQS